MAASGQMAVARWPGPGDNTAGNPMPAARELLRRIYQDHLNLRAARERRPEKVTGADGVARTRAETGHTRPLATVFGQVTLTRIAYRAPSPRAIA
jgi:hypothetical protein